MYRFLARCGRLRGRRALVLCCCAFILCACLTRWGLIRCCRLGSYYACTFELTRLRCRGYRRFTVVHGSKLASILRRRLPMLCLTGYSRRMLFVRECFFLCRGPPGYSARTVEARARRRIIIIDYRLAVDIVNYRYVYVAHRPVVEKTSTLPVPALEPHSAVSKTVINAAIEADMRSPIALVPPIPSVVPSPIPWSPQKTRSRRLYPRARHKIIITIVSAVSPVTVRPNIIVSGANRLDVHRQRGRRYGNRDSNHLPERHIREE